MNNKQRESVARYGYDISKGLVLAAVLTAVTGDASVQDVMKLLAGAAGFFWMAYEVERKC